MAIATLWTSEWVEGGEREHEMKLRVVETEEGLR